MWQKFEVKCLIFVYKLNLILQHLITEHVFDTLVEQVITTHRLLHLYNFFSGTIETDITEINEYKNMERPGSTDF